MKHLISIFLLSVYLYSNNIIVAVASNVSFVINDLKKQFNKLYPNINVKVTLGGSGNLTAQINNGALYDIFMSANMKYPLSLHKTKQTLTKPKVYAQGKLAYLSTKTQDFSKGINLLKENYIKQISVANPKVAPYGKASFEAMKNGNVLNEVKDKLVYAQSISQTLSYTLIATDVGLIAKSALFSNKMKNFKKGIHWIDIDPKLYKPIDQGIVMLKNGQNNNEAKLFYDFILSSQAKKIFTKFGYQLP
jgi:molybdate transport system substrate-binding protein